MIRNASACLAGAVLLAMTAPLSAHHAVTAEFDQNKPITFTGTIKVVEWANPHIYTQVEVKGPDGKTVVYRVEGAAPNSLFRQGWRPDTLKPGDVEPVGTKATTSVGIGDWGLGLRDWRGQYSPGISNPQPLIPNPCA
jgi:hypothetical protein